jgi:hypothetical protein
MIRQVFFLVLILVPFLSSCDTSAQITLTAMERETQIAITLEPEFTYKVIPSSSDMTITHAGILNLDGTIAFMDFGSDEGMRIIYLKNGIYKSIFNGQINPFFMEISPSGDWVFQPNVGNLDKRILDFKITIFPLNFLNEPHRLFYYFPENWLHILYANWSPNSNQIAIVFMSYEGVEENLIWFDGVCILTVKPLSCKIIYEEENKGSFRDVPNLVWSPDGKRIAFEIVTWDTELTNVERTNSSRSKIMITNTDGSNPTQLLNPGSNPVWSPDNRFIAYIGLKCKENENDYTNCNNSLFQVEVDTGISTLLLEDIGKDDCLGDPLFWSKNGEHLILCASNQVLLYDFESRNVTALDKSETYSFRIMETFSYKDKNYVIWFKGNILWIADLDGGSKNRLWVYPIHTWSNYDEVCGKLSWISDDQLVISDGDGTNQVVIDIKSAGYGVIYSPDCTKIIFSANTHLDQPQIETIDGYTGDEENPHSLFMVDLTKTDQPPYLIFDSDAEVVPLSWTR